MAEGLTREPRAVAYAEAGPRAAGPTGATDDRPRRHRRLAVDELGLPTPNLSCGDHTPHSPLEWACLEEMVESVEWLVALAEVWGEDKG